MAQPNFDSLVTPLDHLTHREQLALIERLPHALQEPATADHVIAAQQRPSLRRLQQALAALPVHNPEDGFSNCDHDRLLYGGP
jgi:hypothetical protein